jgi:ABC-type lipopolysaccharide export system ATPase subunit
MGVIRKGAGAQCPYSPPYIMQHITVQRLNFEIFNNKFSQEDLDKISDFRLAFMQQSEGLFNQLKVKYGNIISTVEMTDTSEYKNDQKKESEGKH